jgi:hypothetical protein
MANNNQNIDNNNNNNNNNDNDGDSLIQQRSFLQTSFNTILTPLRNSARAERQLLIGENLAPQDQIRILEQDIGLRTSLFGRVEEEEKEERKEEEEREEENEKENEKENKERKKEEKISCQSNTQLVEFRLRLMTTNQYKIPITTLAL